MGFLQTPAVRAKLVDIFSAVLKRPVGATEHVVRAEEKKWDSLLHVELVFVVEDAFDISFSPEDLERFVSLDAFAEVVASRQAGTS